VQAVQEKAQLQQRKLQEKQDAKELKEKQRKEKLQQQQQLKIEKQQQLSRSSSHLSLLSQHSGSISMGDGSTTPRSENRSSLGDQREGADVVIKMEPQVRSRHHAFDPFIEIKNSSFVRKMLRWAADNISCYVVSMEELKWFEVFVDLVFEGTLCSIEAILVGFDFIEFHRVHVISIDYVCIFHNFGFHCRCYLCWSAVKLVGSGPKE